MLPLTSIFPFDETHEIGRDSRKQMSNPAGKYSELRLANPWQIVLSLIANPCNPLDKSL